MSDKRHDTSIYNFGGQFPPTEQMPVVAPPLTVRIVISSILERDMNAWRALPSTVQDALLNTPSKFELHDFKPGSVAGIVDTKIKVPDLIYNGVRLRWTEDHKYWSLYSIMV